MRVYVALVVFASAFAANAAADSAVEAGPQNLEIEHRSAAEPKLLDRIASLFGVNPGPQESPQAVKKVGIPGGQGAIRQQRPHVRPPTPVYRPPLPKLPPRRQAVAPSYQTPVAVQAPQNVRRQQQYANAAQPPRNLQSSPSNSYAQHSQPGNHFKRQTQTSSSNSWEIAQPANMAQISDLQVQCEKDLMRVRVVFDRPFYGMVFSKGHYSNINCVHVPSGLGQTTATFDIAMGQCGMSTGGNEGQGAPTPQGSFIENTIIVQYDPLLQEVWDQARKLRCTWYDYYEKAVTFRPFGVDMLDPVTANFLGDNLRCWMQIQVGKGPHASEVSGIVKIGQTMTMVLGVKDDENKFDMMVRNCVAHDGKRSPIQLVDEKGCVVRDKIMSPFKKMKNFDSTANVLSFAYFQAFKFPDSMNVHFQCVVQVCRSSCPEPQCGGSLTTNTNSIDSYGSPLGSPISSRADSRIDPRQPNAPSSNYQQASGSERKVTVVHPETKPQPRPIPLKSNSVAIPSPGYSNFNKRIGVEEASSLGGRPRSLEEDSNLEVRNSGPRSLEFGEDESEVEAGVKSERVAKDLKTTDEEEKTDAGNSLEEEKARRRRSAATDRNGNRILRINKREAEEEESSADIEMTERVIRVLAPSDVQFTLNEQDKEKIVVDSEEIVAIDSLCMDTAAFVGIAISFLMILIVAIIVIIFLWLRIRAIDKKNLL